MRKIAREPRAQLIAWIMTVAAFFSLFALCSGVLMAQSLSTEDFSQALKDQGGLVDSFKEAISRGDILWPLLLALSAGLAASLSPCVYPLIPITLSIMGARTYQGHLQGFLVSLSYVTGMSVVYTMLGAVFASLGLLLGSFMQHSVVLVLIAALFTVLALFMLGVFNVVVPAHIMTRLSHIGGQGKKGAFLMGVVAGVLAAPCTGPILGFILTLIANERDIFFGSSLMLSFSMGMGAPFLLLGTFSSAIGRMPKSGTWMEHVKLLFGAAMLGAAIYYLAIAWLPLQTLLSSLRTAGSGVVLMGLAAGVFLLLVHFQRVGHKWLQVQIGLAALLSACAIAVLLIDDAPDVAELGLNEALHWHTINAQTHDHKSFDRLVAQAKSLKKPVMIDFYADWCVACKRLEAVTFSNSEVAFVLKNFLLIRIDATKNSDYLVNLQNRFYVTGLPTVLFIESNGELVKNTKILGFVSVEQFLPVIKKIQ